MCSLCYHFMLAVPNPSHHDKSVPYVSVSHFALPKALHNLFSLFFEFLSHTELSFSQLCFVSLVFVLLLWGTWLLVALLLFHFFVHLSCYHGEPSCSWLSLSWLPCCFSFLLFLSCCHGESLAHDNFHICFFLVFVLPYVLLPGTWQLLVGSHTLFFSPLVL